MSLADPSPNDPDIIEEDPAKRAKSRNLRPLIRLLPMLFKYRLRVILAVLALLMAAAITLLVPIAARRVIDFGFGGDQSLIDNYFATMLLVAAALAIASASRYYLVTWLGEKVVADMREQLFAHLLSLPPAFYERIRTGEVLSRLTADTTQIKSTFGSTASVAMRNLVLLIGAIVMMVVTSAKLSGLTLLALPLIVLPLVIFGRRVRRLSRFAQDMLASSAASAQENLGAARTVQSFGQEQRMTSGFSGLTGAAFAAAASRTKARAILTALIIFIAFGAIIAVLWYGAQDVAAGHITAGTLGQFLLYAAFAAGSMGSLSEVWGEIQLAAGAAERIAELFDTPSEIKSPASPQSFKQPVKGEISFDKVVFRYPNRREHLALDKVSFTVAPGETVAIVGPSGAGKTTLFQLLQRFYDIDSGAITIDGIAIDQLELANLRAQIATVPQDPVIFSSSIEDNIRFGAPGAGREAVIAAAKAARADEFIASLGDGYETKTGERGVTLSGGQRQRIAIARAFLRQAPILLLDEATSALDAESEKHVQAAFEELMQQRTTLVIAHRLATVRNADRIIVMDDAGIVAQGRHGELIKKGGLYARLAKLQFADA